MIPSNSLAAIYGIASDCVERQVLGPDVDIDITVIDETNTRVNIPALIDKFRRNGNFGMVALVGVPKLQISVPKLRHRYDSAFPMHISDTQ